MTHKKEKQFGYLAASILFVALAVGAVVAMRLISPTFSEGTYTYEGKQSHEFSMPLNLASESSKLAVLFTMELPAIHPTHFSITPDDCLTALSINNQSVELPENLCLDKHGVSVDLGSYLIAGKNQLTFVINDFGGQGGISFSPSFKDPLMLSLSLGAILSLVLAAGLFLLSVNASRRIMILSVILGAGLLLRLFLAPMQGFEFDIGVNQGWAKSAALLGMTQSYTQQVDGTMLPNYPPFSLMTFSAVGRAYQLMDPGFDRYSTIFRILIKLPAILADILTALLLYAIVRKSRSDKAGLIAAAVYAVHPAVLYDSAVWGQTDSLYTLLIVASIWGGMTKRYFLSGLFAALSLLTKLQSIIVLPILFLFFVQSKRAALRIIAGVVVAAFVVLLPFAVTGTLQPVFDVYTNAVGFYSSLSYGAYNLWQALFGSASGKSDSDLLFNVISFRLAGLIIFSTATAIWAILRGPHIIQSIRTKIPELPLVATALCAYAFFLFNTEMHERYLFPLMALSLPIIFISWRGIVLYVFASLLFWINMMGVLPMSNVDRALFSAFPNFPAFVGAMQVAVFIAMFAMVLDATRSAHGLKAQWKAAWTMIRQSFRLSR